MSLPYPASQMGDRLRCEVERQLLLDLAHYRPVVRDEKLAIDWSHPCQEGHCTNALGGFLESMSDVVVRDASGRPVADGWLDFVHGAKDLPLFVFWLFLDVVDDHGHSMAARNDPTIPGHIWQELPLASKEALYTENHYDAQWKNDPSVMAWRARSGRQRP